MRARTHYDPPPSPQIQGGLLTGSSPCARLGGRSVKGNNVEGGVSSSHLRVSTATPNFLGDGMVLVFPSGHVHPVLGPALRGPFCWVICSARIRVATNKIASIGAYITVARAAFERFFAERFFAKRLRFVAERLRFFVERLRFFAERRRFLSSARGRGGLARANPPQRPRDARTAKTLQGS